MSGVTLPTCESEEKMRIAFTTCEDVQSGTYFKKGKVSNSKQPFAVNKILTKVLILASQSPFYKGVTSTYKPESNFN